MASKDTRKELSESYVRSSVSPEDAAFNTIPEYLRHHATTRPDKEAFVFLGAEDSREVVTWAQLYDRSVRAAQGFMQLGVKRHEFVAVNVRSCPDWLYINFGIIIAGARVANIHFTYADGSDITEKMKKFETCSTMVLDAGVDDENWIMFKKLVDKHSDDGTLDCPALPYLKYLVVLDRPENTPDLKTFHDILTDAPSSIELPDLDGDEVIILFETSGSTGIPKVIAHTHTSLIARFTSTNSSSDDEVDFSGDFKYYNDRPMFWIGGWPFNVVNGTTRVTRSGLDKDPEDIIAFTFNAAKREKCDLMFALPHLLHAMIERKGEIGPDLLLKCIGTGGQPITKESAKCIGAICNSMAVGYAGTEIGLASVMVVKKLDAFEDYATGHLLPGVEIKIVDAHEKIVPVGVNGEIYVRSKNTFQQYWNDPQKTQSVLTADGWLKTDDIGHVSKEGMLYVEGRKSDVIISGGLNVSPAVLESAIKTCPGVADVMVVPISHPSLFQAVCACVIPAAGCDLTEEALRDYCESVHNNQFTVMPKHYLIFEKFPKTRNGKTSRKELAIIAEKLLKGL